MFEFCFLIWPILVYSTSYFWATTRPQNVSGPGVSYPSLLLSRRAWFHPLQFRVMPCKLVRHFHVLHFYALSRGKGKSKGKVQYFLQRCLHETTHDQKRFTISKVPADWHELMILQCTMRPSINRVNKQLDSRFAASRHTTAPISHTRPSPRSP